MPISRSALAFAILFALTAAVAATSVVVFTAHGPTFYGTALAPHSDALTSWLHGTLGYYFYGESHNSLLLRPLISVMYAGVLTVSELGGFWSLGNIPVFFAGLYGAALLTVCPLLDTRGRLALLALTGLAAAGHGVLIDAMAPDSLNTDFPSFALTAAGLLLALVPLTQQRPSAGPLALSLAGWTLLGLAAAIRGPGLLFGPALLAVYALVLRSRLGAWRPALAAALAAGAIFAGISAADGILRTAAGVGSQGLLAFYAFYADPGHTLTNDAYFSYVALKPTAWEVLTTYLGFLASPAGWQALREAAWSRLTLDGTAALSVGFPWLLAGALALDCGMAAAAARRDGASPWRALAAPARLVKLAMVALAGAAAVDAGAYVLRTAPSLAPYVVHLTTPLALAAGLSLITLAWGAATGRTMAAAFALVYLLGTAFVILTGAKDYARVVHTYVLALYAGPLWVIFDPAERLDWSRGRRVGAGVAAGAFGLTVLAAATANFLLSTPMKELYRVEARERPAAVKLSEDRALDRALYFSGGREVLYTRADGAPIGTVRDTTGFENPNGVIGPPEELEGLRAFNALFQNPGRFAASNEGVRP